MQRVWKILCYSSTVLHKLRQSQKNVAKTRHTLALYSWNAKIVTVPPHPAVELSLKNKTNMNAWWSLSAAEREAMKRLEFEPELGDRDNGHKGRSFGTLFKLLVSILTDNGSWERKTCFHSSNFLRAASLTLSRPIESFSIPRPFDRRWEGHHVNGSLLNPMVPFWTFLNSIWFDSVFLRVRRDIIRFDDIILIVVEVQREDVSKNNLHRQQCLTIKPYLCNHVGNREWMIVRLISLSFIELSFLALEWISIISS